MKKQTKKQKIAELEAKIIELERVISNTPKIIKLTPYDDFETQLRATEQIYNRRVG